MGIDIPKPSDPDEYFRIAEAAGADYLVFDAIDFLTVQYSVPAVQAYPGSFCIARLGDVQGTAVLGLRDDVPRERAVGGQPAIDFQLCPESAP